MDNRENINWNEEIDQLREQVRSQEARIAALEAELAGMRQTAPQPQAAPPNWQQMPPQQAPPAWQQTQGQPRPASPNWQQMPPQPQRWPKPPKPKQKLSETAVGKYGVGVLASVLILLGVFTAVQIFWGRIPDILKLMLLLWAGAGIAALGYVFTMKTNRQNGFWQSVTATGAAIVFIALAAGALAWKLYGPAVLGILLFLWFLVCLFASGKIQSRVFYVVSYIGANVAMLLAILQIEKGWEVQAVVGFGLLALVMPAVGIARQKKEVILPWLNYIFLNLTAILCAQEIPRWDEKDWLGPIVLTAVQALSAAAALMEAGFIMRGDKPWKRVWKAILGLIPVVLLVGAFFQECPEYGDPLLPPMAAGSIPVLLMVLAGAVLMREKQNLEFAPVLAGAIAWCAVRIPEDVELVPQILPAAVLFAAGMAVISKREERELRLAAYVWYLVMLAGAFSIDWPGELQLLTAAVVLTAEGLWLYLSAVKRPVIFPLLEPLLFALVTPLPVYLLLFEDFTAVNLPEILPVAASVVMFVFFKLTRLVPASVIDQEAAGPAVPGREAIRRKADGEWILAEVIAHGAATIFQLTVYLTTFSLFSSYEPTLVDKTVNPVLLLALAAAGIYGAVVSGRILLAVPAVFSLNCSLFYIADVLMDGDGTALFVSILGIVASALLIGIGFAARRKNLRIMGLITMIIYVLKISVFDLAESTARGMNVLLLILGGLVCFAISFTYNRLDKKYGEKREMSPPPDFTGINGGPQGR